MHEVQVGEHTYSIRKLDPITQLHLVRRLAPVLVSLGVTVGEDGKPKVDNPFAMLQPATAALADMSDANFDFVVKTCLGATFRKTAEGFRPVMPGGVNMFSGDMEGGDILQLVWEVGKVNLEGFIRTFQSLAPKPKSADEA